ncbi:hypothetical protein ABW21_db0204854 [Orbilia brochopaga]|nr:hypothetical protein ABW21_db0204854 [Drechslerella brochopaga]
MNQQPLGGPMMAAGSLPMSNAVAAVANKFRSLQQPTVGWQAEIVVGDRWKIVSQMASSLRLVRADLDAPRAIKMAEAFEEQTFSNASSKDEYLGACGAKMKQIQETRMQKHDEQQQQQFIGRPGTTPSMQAQQQLLIQQAVRAGVPMPNMPGGQRPPQPQPGQQQQQPGMMGMMPQNMNMAAAMAANQSLQHQMAMAGAQSGMPPQNQQLPPNHMLHQYRGMSRDQAIAQLARTMMNQAQPQHIQTIMAQLGTLTDEQKAQCELLKISAVELFFRNAAQKKLFQSMPGAGGPGGPGPQAGTPQLSAQQIQAQQIQGRQQQIQQQQQRLMAAQAGIGRGQNLGQPQPSFDNKLFMNDVQNFLTQQQQAQQQQSPDKQPGAARPGMPNVTMPPGSVPPPGAPQLAQTPQQQQQQQLFQLQQRQAQQVAQQRQAQAQAQQQALLGQHASPQMNLLNQTHMPGAAPGSQAAQALQAQAQAQAQLNQAKLLDMQARQQGLQHAAGMPRPLGNFPIPPGFPIGKFQNLAPEQLQQLVHNWNTSKQQHAAQALAQQQNQNNALQQQQAAAAAHDAQNRLRNGKGIGLGTPAQQIVAAQNALLQNMPAYSMQSQADLQQKVNQQRLLNLQMQQGQLAKQLAAQSVKQPQQQPPQPAQPAQRIPPAATPQQQAQQPPQQQQTPQSQPQQQAQQIPAPQAGQGQQPGQPRPLPMIPDVPFPPAFDNIKPPLNAIAFLKRNISSEAPDLPSWGAYKEWAKRKSPDIASKVDP